MASLVLVGAAVNEEHNRVVLLDPVQSRLCDVREPCGTHCDRHAGCVRVLDDGVGVKRVGGLLGLARVLGRAGGAVRVRAGAR